MELLIQVIRQQPRFTKEASSALINLGEAVCSTSIRDDIDVLLLGTLHQEAYVRNSCLQTLQVRCYPYPDPLLIHSSHPAL
jgi:hypothetical protein